MRVFGLDKIQFHQIMEKLSDHLFELEPLKIDFSIDPSSAKRVHVATYFLKVTAFSDTPQKLLAFLADFNYQYRGIPKDAGL